MQLLLSAITWNWLADIPLGTADGVNVDMPLLSLAESNILKI